MMLGSLDLLIIYLYLNHSKHFLIFKKVQDHEQRQRWSYKYCNIVYAIQKSVNISLGLYIPLASLLTFSSDWFGN